MPETDENFVTTEQTSACVFDSGVSGTRYPFQIETTLSLPKSYRTMRHIIST
ncbi:uncharacterized protein METZ01_LOCUS90957 [marine metagenome]|uniref:Uncharacterized protein n=1 Tax=marine metagenome TaxID=408172 RepID=A0A381VFB4_9ZZZZ